MRAEIFVRLCLTGILFWVAPSAGAESAEKWGPFQGQIVDVETGQPIAGAVVLVFWRQDVPNPVQAQSKFYDAREAVTDAAGRFEVPRLDPPFFSFTIYDPEFYWFAPGYDTANVVGDASKGKRYIVPTLVEMRKLKTRKELMERLSSRPGGVPLSKMTELTKAINIERKMLGLSPLPIIVEGGER